MKLKKQGRSLNVSVQDYIKDHIVENDLQAGDALPPEGQIAADLGVSRSPVREAVKALQSVGIIEVRHGEGLFVREWNFDPLLENFQFGIRVSPQKIAELYQVRKWLEMAVIGECVERISDDEIMELDILMLQWERALRSGEDYIEYDEKFHQIILGTIRNETLLKLFSTFWAAFKSSKESDMYSPELDRVLREHQNVVDAIKQRDPDLAQKMLHEQFLGFQERIQEIIDRHQKRKVAGKDNDN